MGQKTSIFMLSKINAQKFYLEKIFLLLVKQI